MRLETRNSKLFSYFALLLFLSLAASAADINSPGFVSALPVAPITLKTGKQAQVALSFKVKSGYHINSNLPHSDLLIPTKLKLDVLPEIGIGKITYPHGKDISLSFAPQEKLNVYTGDFTIEANVRSMHSLAAGRYRVQGELSYQACSDNACYAPKKLPVSFEIVVLPARAGAGR